MAIKKCKLLNMLKLTRNGLVQNILDTSGVLYLWRPAAAVLASLYLFICLYHKLPLRVFTLLLLL